MDYSQIARDGLFYDLAKWALLSFLSTSGVTFLASKVFKKLENRTDVAYFSVTVFLILFAFLFVVSPRTQTPVLASGIETVVSGSPSSDEKLTLTVLTMSVMNSGTMQSIVKGWSVEAKINGRSYYGTFLAQPPKNFVFQTQDSAPNTPTAIVYHSEDNLVNKALTPIQPGGLTNGLLYVVFDGIDPGLFKGGVDYTVRFQDVLSHHYESTISTSAISSRSLVATPGLHSDLVCPVPKQGLAPRNVSPIPTSPPLAPN